MPRTSWSCRRSTVTSRATSAFSIALSSSARSRRGSTGLVM